MFALYLNPVTANAERYLPVAISHSREEIERFMEGERCESYSDGTYHRSFREGPLHNFNPPQMNGTNCFGSPEGIIEIIGEDDLRQEYEERLSAWRSHFSTATFV